MEEGVFSFKKVVQKMGRIAMIAIIAMFIAGAVSAQTKTFTSDKGYFKFSYPSNFAQQKINNAPHMLVKLASEKYIIAVSFEQYNFENSVTIWDTDIYDYYLNLDKSISKSGNDVLCKKQNLILKNKTVKVLKSVVIQQNESVVIKQLTFRVMHRGNYLQFVFFTMNANDTLFEKECENIMKGVELL